MQAKKIRQNADCCNCIRNVTGNSPIIDANIDEGFSELEGPLHDRCPIIRTGTTT